MAASGRTPYVGREAERADARQFLDRLVTSGQGGLLFLGGEPGVGKTRLAEEVLAEARQRGCLSLTGRCYEAEGAPPFIPWVEIVERSARMAPDAFRETLGESASEVARLVPSLRQRIDDIPAPVELPAAQQRHYLFTNFLAFIERGAHTTPHVLLLDDLHWADQSTLHLLEHIAPHLGEMPMIIVGTYRDVDLDVARPFPKTLETLTRQRLARKLALKRLPEGDVTEILAALGGQAPPRELAAIIYRETEGNPFFVEEVFQHLFEEGRLFGDDGQWRSDLDAEALDVPEGIRLVLGRRIGWCRMPGLHAREWLSVDD